jgi:hypothetical protein
MRKITLVMALLLSLVVVKAQRIITFENVDYCIGAIFNKVSNNGKYVAGYAEASLNGSNVGFVYLVESGEMVVLNPEWEEYPEQSHLVSAAANDVSNDGIVAGHYCFDDTYRRPAIYNLSTGLWTKLELPSSVDGKITEAGSKYGEATSISSDGKYISGYVKSRMDNSEGIKIVPRDVPCVWVRVNDDVLNPEYKLQMPIDTDHTKISCNGDWAWHMSDDAKWMGGNSSAKSGSFNVTIWENHFNDSLLDRQIIIGKDDWDRSVDDNGDGVIDDEDGADEGQYDWNGIVSCISPNGEWVVGYHTFNGTGYGQANQSAVGFRYNTKTKVLEDSLMAGCPTVVFDDGEMIFDRTGVMSSSDDKSVQCGTAVIATDLGNLNVPMLILMDETAVENVEDLGVNVFVNNSILTIEGEYTSVEVYSVSGAMIALFDGTMNEINLSNLAKGVYLVRVINENQAITKKITL